MAKPLVYLLNGNSNEAATERYARAATAYFGERAAVEARTLVDAPLYIATRRDCARAAVGILDHAEARLARRDLPKPDALILACFGEPGLGALRELSDIPMFGLLEASARAVAGRGKSFSILGGPHAIGAQAVRVRCAEDDGIGPVTRGDRSRQHVRGDRDAGRDRRRRRA